jgi:hypothetical protein
MGSAMPACASPCNRCFHLAEMAQRKLTKDEWALARRRWEGSPRAGFAWLAAEIKAAWGVGISRPAVRQMATKPGAEWVKGPGEDAPLAVTLGAKRAQPPRAIPAKPSRPDAAEVSLSGDGPQRPKFRLAGGTDVDPKTRGGLRPTNSGGDAEAARAAPEGSEGADVQPQAAGQASAALAGDPGDVSQVKRPEDKAGRVWVAAMNEARRTGRPPDYVPEFAELAMRLNLLGATDEEMAEVFGVDVRTFYRWVERHAEFCHAVRHSERVATANVAHGLYMRATGYVGVKEKLVSVPVGGGVSVVERHRHEEYVAPDVKAAQTWLFNKRPQDWRNNVVFTPAPPNTIPDTKWLDEVYERKQAAARELQAKVAGRMERMGITLAIADSAGDEELLNAARVIDEPDELEKGGDE